MSNRNDNRNNGSGNDLNDERHGVFSQRNLIAVSIACAVFALADLTYENHHPHVRFETWFNFFGFFAAIITATTFAIAPAFGSFLKRAEDYYDE